VVFAFLDDSVLDCDWIEARFWPSFDCLIGLMLAESLSNKTGFLVFVVGLDLLRAHLAS
jgi:hypothetical protein